MEQAIRRTIAAGAFGLFASTASAALVTESGEHFDLVYNDTQSALSAFGLPTLVGDLISFAPSNFKAKSENGTGITSKTETINLEIHLHDGYRIQSLHMVENGDYLMHGLSSLVGVAGQTRVFDPAQGLPSLIVQSIVSGSDLTIINPGLGGQTHEWSASTAADLSGVAYEGTEQLSYSIQNILQAYTDIADSGPKFALIEKKFVSIDVGVSAIPEAEVWAMMLVGVGLVGFQLRRKARRMATHRLA